MTAQDYADADARLRQQSDAAAARTRTPPGNLDQNKAFREQSAEQIGKQKRVGSTADQRAGLDPLYTPGSGVQSSQNSRNSLTPNDNWNSTFARPAAGSATGATRADPFASGLWPAPPSPWTGPSLSPQVGPGSAPPFVPGQQGTNFVVPKPLTGPQGNAESDATNLAANLAMAQPGGASGMWQHPSTSQPSTDSGVDPAIAALGASGKTGMTPYGPIRATPGNQAQWDSVGPTPTMQTQGFNADGTIPGTTPFEPQTSPTGPAVAQGLNDSLMAKPNKAADEEEKPEMDPYAG